MYFENDVIDIYFSKPFYKTYDVIHFLPNKNFIYYDHSHLNYIYKIDETNIEHTFYGFYKDDYFVIIHDSYDKNLNVNLENKNVILIELKWILKKVSEDKSVWILDKKDILLQLKYDSLILPIRNKYLNQNNITNNEHIRLTEYKTIPVKIKINDIQTTQKS